MSQDQDAPKEENPSGPVECAECGTRLDEGAERVATDGGTFCRPCYNNLTEQLRQAVIAQGQDINYPMAVVGAVAGAAIGVVAWWGFTVLTNIAFGLVAIVIGVAVAKGTVILSGNKRSTGLQVISIVVSTLAFVYASYLVNRTFVNRAIQADGIEGALPLLPDPDLFIEVLSLSAGFMDLIFLAIVVYEAWKIPAPIKLEPST